MASARKRAKQLDAQDSLRSFRDEFHIPTKAQIASTTLETTHSFLMTAKPAQSSHSCKEDSTLSPTSTSTLSLNSTLTSNPSLTLTQTQTSPSPPSPPCTYLCGNSLGLQPKLTSTRIQAHLATWATQGVQGHFKPLENSSLPTWLDADEEAAEMMAEIVGAKGGKGEVVVMQTLTANLHLLMSAFYKPDKESGRVKIVMERGAFPSDFIAVETQLRHHNLSPSTSLLLLDPPSPSSSSSPLLTTPSILSFLTAHAQTLSLILLPGIQYYTGQLLDIPTITAHARSLGIFIIWDLAHAVGNVELKLSEWGVDAAVWCTYKYLNAGPGGVGGMFVAERHSRVGVGRHGQKEGESEGKEEGKEKDEKTTHPHRLAGWWANPKSTRFAMSNTPFIPTPGAAGFQLSNPSILDITSVCASLEVFKKAGGVKELRKKSVMLTGFLEELLLGLGQELQAEDEKKGGNEDVGPRFSIITPKEKEWRGAQLSLRLEKHAPSSAADQEGLLDRVMAKLTAKGVIVDERRPDVIRVAPAPLYNSFEDCVNFVEAFGQALREA